MAKINDPSYAEAASLTGFLIGYQDGATKRFPAALFGGGGAPLLRAGTIAWVDGAHGDDLTAEMGNPSKPYLTAQAAYAAAVAMGGNKVLVLSPGAHFITAAGGNVTGTFLGYGTMVTTLLIDVQGTALADAAAGNGGSIDIEIDRLTVSVSATGGGAWTTDEMYWATGGAGGNVAIKGHGIASANVNGGGASGPGATTGGNAGQAVFKGLTVLGVNATGGAGASMGMAGDVYMDDCDASACAWTIDGARMHFGRTSYSSAAAAELSSLYTDRGGNANSY